MTTKTASQMTRHADEPRLPPRLATIPAVVMLATLGWLARNAIPAPARRWAAAAARNGRS
jgi:hypothetical protein